MSVNPNSRYQRALALLRETPVVTKRDFQHLLAKVCDTKSQMETLRIELTRRGAIEMVVRLKEPPP